MRKIISIVILVILTAAVTASFAGPFENYADFERSASVESMVKAAELPGTYHYYYTGRSELPYAVIGLHRKYRINGGFWFKIESIPKMVEKSKSLMPIGNPYVHYSKILDADGNQIGIWVSEYPNTVLRFESADLLTILSPYQPNDNV